MPVFALIQLLARSLTHSRSCRDLTALRGEPATLRNGKESTTRRTFGQSVVAPPARTLSVVLAGALVAGCSTTEIPFIYRLNVQQGNVVDATMLTQLQPGMDRQRVRFIMGTPLVEDPFNADRWDYYYSLREGTARRNQRIVTLLFEADRLKRIVGDVEPGSGEPVAPRPEQVVDVPPAEPEGFFAALTPNILKSEEAKRRARARERLGEGESEGEQVASEQAEGEASPQDAAATGETAAGEEVAALSPARPLSARAASAETQYFTKLFRGYGRAPGVATEQAALTAPAGAEASAVSDDEAPADAAQASPEDGDETFLQRLARQFKEDQKNADPNAPPAEGGDR